MFAVHFGEKGPFFGTLLLLLFFVFASINDVKAQLNVGDIAFVQYNADGTDNFAFVSLVDIPGNEIVYFTDNEENTLTGGEGTITWTAPANGVSCGTVVVIDVSPSASLGTVTEYNSLNFSASGDAILAYQGSSSSPTFIAALENDGGWGNANSGNLPAGLIDGSTAISINPEVDNCAYNGITTGNQATLLSAINGNANWTLSSNSTNQIFSGTFLVTNCNVVIPQAISLKQYHPDQADPINGPIPISPTTPTAINFNNVYIGSFESRPESYVVSASGLTDNLIITAPSGYEISLNCTSGFTSSILLSPTNGNVAETVIFVKFNPSYYGTFSGNITHSSTGVTTQNIALNETNIPTNLPSNYYNAATGTGATLKTNLYNIISAHTQRTYADLWTDFQVTDRKPNGKVYDMESDVGVCSTAPYEHHYTSSQCGTFLAEGYCYNREHTIPSSWMGSTQSDPNHTDLFHVIPCDGWVNNMHSNLALGVVTNPSNSSMNGSKRGPNTFPGSPSNNVFEPVDEYKGDFARNYFYMATAYENIWASWSGNSTNGDLMLEPNTFPAFDQWAVDMLLLWNATDPVDQKEKNRNDAIYIIQGNRNPFIDNPDFANLIWGNPTIIPTEVSFIQPTSGNYNEGDGTITIDVEIVNPSLTNATTVEVVLSSGSVSGLNNYTTQTLTFPAGSSANQSVSVTITDDLVCSGNLSTYTLALQNPQGGNTTVLGSQTTFTINVQDNDMVLDLMVNVDYETGDISNWTQSTTGEWSTYNGVSPAVLNGAYSLRNDSDLDGDGTSSIQLGYDDCLSGVLTTWRFQVYFGYEPSMNNYFLVYLTDNAVPETGTGYAIGVFPQTSGGLGDPDLVELYKMQGGNILQTIVSTPVSWTTNNYNTPPHPAIADKAGFEITRDENGLWEVKLDIDGGFDNLVSYGLPSVNTDYDFTENFGVFHHSTAGGASALMLDDISITQAGCSVDYYSQGTGMVDAAIWDVVPSGVGQNFTPSKFANIFIQDGHSVTLNNDLSCNDLTLSTLGVLDAQDKSICIYGNVINNGNFIEGTSRVNFNGSVSQTLTSTGASPMPFYELAINNPAGVASSSALDIVRAVYPNQGIFDITNATLTLKSSATGTGSIAEIKSGADIQGNITLERYIMPDTGSDAYPGGWVGLAGSIQGNTFADWNNDLITTGFPGADYPNYSYPGGGLFNNIVRFDEPTGSWVGATGLNNSIVYFFGYFVYMNQYETTTHLSGPFSKGNVNLGLSKSGSMFNLISVPYPCAVDWDLVYQTYSNISPTYWIYDSDNGIYKSYNAVTQSGTASNIIAASQSFWVQALPPANIGSTVNFYEDRKVVAADVWERAHEVKSGLGIVLKDQEENLLDKCFVGENTEATTDFDVIYDSQKIKIPMPGGNTIFISTISEDGVELQQNLLPSLTSDVLIPIKLSYLTLNEEYHLSFEQLELLDESVCLSLHDNLLNTNAIINEETVVDFIANQENTNRFVLQLSTNYSICNEENQAVGLKEEPSEDDAIFSFVDHQLIFSSLGTETRVDIFVYNDLGQEILAQSKGVFGGKTSLSVGNLSTGIYLVQAFVSGKNLVSEKIIIGD